MSKSHRVPKHILLWVSLISLSTAVSALAQEEEKKLGWADTAEISFVTAGGNAEANTLGLRNTLTHTWDEALFTLNAGALRASTGTFVRTAVGTPDAFDVQKEADSELTAENYLLRTRYDRTLNDRLFWFAGGGWDRNVFAGIQNRFEGNGGVGHVWLDEEASKFRTTYGLSVIHQEDVVGNALTDETFVAARLSSDYQRKLTDTASYVNQMIVNQNLQETSDLRFDLVNALSVSISQQLALKVTHQLLFDNLPSLEEIALFNPAGTPLGVRVQTPLQKYDTVLNVALVIAF